MEYFEIRMGGTKKAQLGEYSDNGIFHGERMGVMMEYSRNGLFI